MKKSTLSLTDTAILAAFCMFLSIIEYMIPKPLPFLRLGLAHLPVLISLMIFPVRGTLLLTLLKILGQGLVNGTLFSYVFLFSASGSIASTLVMLAVYRLLKNRVSLVGVSVAGATASNIVQLLLARQFIFGRAATLIAPPFLAAGIVTSVLLGLFAAGFAARSEWLGQRMENRMQPPTARAAELAVTAGAALPRFAFVCGLLSIPAFLFQPDTALLAAEAVIFIIFSAAFGKRFRLLPNLLMAAGIIAANLITPYGRVLLELGPLTVTLGALEAGARKAAVIIGLIYISRSSVRKGLRLPGRLGSMLSLVFYYFERLTEGERVTGQNAFRQLDERLTALSSLPAEPVPAAGPAAEPAAGSAVAAGAYFAAAAPCIIAWLMFAAALYLTV